MLEALKNLIVSSFEAYSILIFCLVYYARINPSFAYWLIEKAREIEEEKEKNAKDKNR